MTVLDSLWATLEEFTLRGSLLTEPWADVPRQPVRLRWSFRPRLLYIPGLPTRR